MPPVQVALIGDRFWNSEGGTERQMALLARSLPQAGVKPSVFFLRSTGNFAEAAPGTPVRSLGIDRLAERAAWRSAVDLMQQLRAAGVSVCQTFFNDSSLLFPYAARRAGLRAIVSRRDLGFWHTSLTRAVARINGLLFVDAVVANCAAVRESVVRDEWIAPQRIHVIPNAISTQLTSMERGAARERLALAQDAAVITIVANLRPLKRIDTVVRAMAELARDFPRVVLLVAGEDVPVDSGGSALEGLRSLGAELGIVERLRFLGRIEDPSAVIAAADVCVLASETEGLSNSIMEYLWMGRPVVCTDVGGNPELVEHGRSGYLFATGDWRALAAHLRTLLGDPALAAECGARGREFVVSRLTPERLADSHAQLYRKLAS